MRISRTSIPLVLVTAIALLLGACASSGAASLSGSANRDGEGVNAGTGDGYALPGASAAPGAPGDVDGGGDNQIGAVDDAKIIRTGTISLEVSDVPGALRTARDGIAAMGGYIGASNTYTDTGDRPVASITYRIPADRWEDALDLLRGLNGLTTDVVAEQTEAVEVTGQVVDLEARIRNLRASETALQEIARSAVRVADVLEIQAQLTSVRGEIEVLSGQLKELEDRAAFATLTAQYSMPIVAVEIAAEGWDPARVVDEASASLVSVLQGLTTAGIWFAIVWLPILVVLGIVVLAGTWIVRRTGLLARRAGGPSAPAA
jgi:hypothetical protein